MLGLKIQNRTRQSEKESKQVQRPCRRGASSRAAQGSPAPEQIAGVEQSREAEVREIRLFQGPTIRPCLRDRKSTRLNSSHQINSYAVFCLKKKKKQCALQSLPVCLGHYGYGERRRI